MIVAHSMCEEWEAARSAARRLDPCIAAAVGCEQAPTVRISEHAPALPAISESVSVQARSVVLKTFGNLRKGSGTTGKEPKPFHLFQEEMASGLFSGPPGEWGRTNEGGLPKDVPMHRQRRGMGKMSLAVLLMPLRMV